RSSGCISLCGRPTVWARKHWQAKEIFLDALILFCRFSIVPNLRVKLFCNVLALVIQQHGYVPERNAVVMGMLCYAMTDTVRMKSKSLRKNPRSLFAKQFRYWTGLPIRIDE